jgi:hypothetical protein
MRTTSKSLVFRHPFKLSGVDDVQPAGSYAVETVEEQLDRSFDAYRRIVTMTRLPGTPGTAETGRVIDIDPADLGTLQARDAAHPSPPPEKTR